MATLNFIAGQQVAGASLYNLYYEKADGSNEKFAEREIIQNFKHKGVIVNGKPQEESFRLDRFGGTENGSVLLYPLRMLTDVGAKSGFKVEGQVSVIYKDGVRIYKAFETIHYIDKENSYVSRIFMPPQQNQIIKKDGGWYLNINVNGEENMAKIMDVTDDISSIAFYPDYNDLEITGAAMANEYAHTDYIYIGCLTDDYNAPGTSELACVSSFDLSEELGYSKMSFYNKDLKFIADAKVTYLQEDYGHSYYTKEEVITVAYEVCGTTDENSENFPKFVVFCSKESKTANKDVVSIGNPYFPLFDMQEVNEVLVTENTNTLKLSVTADSKNDYYTESNRSNQVTYTAPQ